MSLVCSICADKYISSDDVNTTPCGHMFHRACLLPWIEQSPTCPECRTSCNVAGLAKVYLNIESPERARERWTGLQQQLADLQVKTRVQENVLKDLQKTISDNHREQEEMRSDMAEQQKSMKRELKTLQKKYERCLKTLTKMDQVASALAVLNQNDDNSTSCYSDSSD